MYVGDLLEVLAALFVVAAIFVLLTLICMTAAIGGALLATGIFLGYEAQLVANVRIRTKGGG